MKRKIFVILFLMLFINPFEVFAQPRLTIRKFDDKTEARNAPADAITEMMTTELSKTGIFNLLEREKINYVADEIAFGQSGLVEPSTAQKVGKIKGHSIQ